MVGQAVHCTTLQRAGPNIDIVDLDICRGSFLEDVIQHVLRKGLPFPKLHEINSMA